MARFVLLVLSVCACLSTASPDIALAEQPLGSAAAGQASPFAKSNLHVWAFEEYDAVKRTPRERAQLLKELGITKAGYICRNAARVAEFEAYVEAYRDAGIELIAVWTPVHTKQPLEEPQIKVFLEVVDRHQLSIQWWLTLEEDFDALPAESRVGHAVTQLRPLVSEANKRQCRLVTYGHGGKRWFTQYENQIAIIEQLQGMMPDAELGIIYNFHQSHAQMDRMKSVFPRLQPYLVALNLNGMYSDGPRIETLGQGDHEKEMIRTVFESAWRGPVGIIHHQRKMDPKITLRNNLNGLHSILTEIGDTSAASTY